MLNGKEVDISPSDDDVQHLEIHQQLDLGKEDIAINRLVTRHCQYHLRQLRAKTQGQGQPPPNMQGGAGGQGGQQGGGMPQVPTTEGQVSGQALQNAGIGGQR